MELHGQERKWTLGARFPILPLKLAQSSEIKETRNPRISTLTREGPLVRSQYRPPHPQALSRRAAFAFEA